MLQDYYKEKKTREEQKLPPLPLNVNQTEEIVKAFETNKATEKDLILIENEVPPGVDEASFIKAAFLKDIALHKIISQEPELLSRVKIKDEKGKDYSVTEFLDKVEKWKIIS